MYSEHDIVQEMLMYCTFMDLMHIFHNITTLRVIRFFKS